MKHFGIALLTLMLAAPAAAEEAEWEANRSEKTVSLIKADGTGVQLKCHVDEDADTRRLAVIIYTDTRLGAAGDSVTVHTTIDDGARTADTWTIGDVPGRSGSAVVLGDTRGPRFAVQLADGEETLAVDVAGSNDAHTTGTFDLEDGQFIRGVMTRRCQ